MNKMEMKTKIMTQMYLHKMTTSIRQLMKNTQTGTRTSLVAIVVDILFDILLLYKYHSEAMILAITDLTWLYIDQKKSGEEGTEMNDDANRAHDKDVCSKCLVGLRILLALSHWESFAGRSIIISILFYAPYICEPLSLIKNTVPTRCHLQGKGYELPGVFRLPLCAWAG